MPYIRVTKPPPKYVPKWVWVMITLQSMTLISVLVK